jgi:hypothetical protein
VSEKGYFTPDKTKPRFKTCFSETHQPVQPRGSDLEKPIWEVVYDPNEDSRELGKRGGRHRYVESFNKVSVKIRE